uniref:Putative secreted protein n=1 Tax=Anopheles marajoara TaxID=58244 RepID=A0A2M4CAV9_9DIPT
MGCFFTYYVSLFPRGCSSLSVPHLTLLVLIVDTAYVEYVVTPDQHLAEVSRVLPIDKLFRVGQLHVHVTIDRHQEALVLVAPL